MRVGVAIFVLLVSATAEASAIGVAAEHVAHDVGAIPAGALVVTAPLESDVAPTANRADELALRIASIVAGKAPGAHAHGKTLTLEQARVAAARSSMLVYVHSQIQKGQLRVTVDAYPVVRNIWDRARLAAPPPSAHAYAAAPIDAEVRSFFPALPLEMTSVHKAPHAEGDVLAVACGDLDGDGGAEIMLVSRERASLGRMRAGKIDVERSVQWSALAKRVPVPLREPVGGAQLEVGRALLGSSDRGGVIVDDMLGAPHATLSGIPIGAGACAPVAPGKLAFDGAIASCESAAASSRSTAAFDAASAFELVAPSGDSRLAVATREAGKLHVRIGGAEKSSFDGAGAQVVVFDANFDGSPEVAFSNDGPSDAITITTISDAGTRVVNRIAAPAGVRALAACPSDGGGSALVAVVGNEVWLVR